VIGKLIESGYSVHVLAPRDPYTDHFENLPGLTYIELRHFRAKSISPRQDLRLYKELLQHYRQIRPHLIFHYTIKANIFGALAAAKAGIPAIGVITGLGYAYAGKGWLQSIARILYRSALRKNREVWFLNEDDRQVFVGQRLVPKEKTFILPGEGVDTTAFYPAPYENDKPEVTYLLIGRIIRHKGIYEFVEAAAQLQKDGLKVRCQLLGVFDEGNPVAISRQEVTEWERRKIVDYLGSTDEVPPVIQQADCIVLPSWREGMPLSLLEGASMTKALIATDTPGCRAIVEEGHNGYRCRPKDGTDLARKMTEFYHLPATAKRQMGVAGRDKVLLNFTRERVLDIYLEKICAYCS
jgi:glycosyltransferase involved in cell wall biosynthesis